MKRNIISNILLVMLAIVLAGCEKLPDLDGNDNSSYYFDNLSDIVKYSLPTSVKFNANYYNIQMSENSDFSGAAIIDFTHQDGSYATDKIITNLKPGTTYYYREVVTDYLDGVKYGDTYSFTTQSQDFQFVKSVVSSWTVDNYGSEEYPNYHYELSLTVNFNDYLKDLGLEYNLYVQTPEGDYPYERQRQYISDSSVQISFYGNPSDKVTYWITIIDTDGGNNTVLYTSEKTTITCPAVN